jgi:methyltransferase of FxLD system
VRSPRIEAALLAVPREAFLPGVPLDEVYRPSEAIVTKRVDGMSVSSASAPEVIALMLEQLNARPGDHVLEIGAGTGYNAALLAHMVGETGRVVTLDLDEDLVASAREHLDSAGYERVTVVQTDGALGYPGERPYDRIMLTVASADIAPAWREQLARPHGRLVMPLSLRGLQRCVVFAFDAADSESLVTRSLRNCSFIALRGLLSTEVPRLPVDRDAPWMLAGEDNESPPLRSERVAELLSHPLRAAPTGVSISLDELRDGLYLWLVAHEADIHTLWTAARLPDVVPDRSRPRQPGAPGARRRLQPIRRAVHPVPAGRRGHRRAFAGAALRVGAGGSTVRLGRADPRLPERRREAVGCRRSSDQPPLDALHPELAGCATPALVLNWVVSRLSRRLL